MTIPAKIGSQSKSSPFAILARESYLVFVSSEEHIREVENSPQDQLSFHKAMEDVRHHRNINRTYCSPSLIIFLETKAQAHL